MPNIFVLFDHLKINFDVLSISLFDIDQRSDSKIKYELSNFI